VCKNHAADEVHRFRWIVERCSWVSDTTAGTLSYSRQGSQAGRSLTHCSMPEKLRPVSDDDVSNMPVEVRLLGVQQVTGRGALKWLFNVQIDIQGVEIEARGFQGRETARGGISIRAPQFRGGDGRWLPALILPPSIMSAVGDAFVEEIGRPELAGRGVGGK
jgi:hypothetical protein